MTMRPFPGVTRDDDIVVGVGTGNVDYVRARSTAWLSRRFSQAAPADYTNADALGINEQWPGGDDDRLSDVGEVIREALDSDVILLNPRRVEDARLIQTRGHDGVLTGARLFVTLVDGVTLASDNPLWSTDFVGEQSGLDAVYAAIGHAAAAIDALVAGYHRANRSAPASPAPKTDAPQSLWDDNHVQFPRLIAEMEAAGFFDTDVPVIEGLLDLLGRGMDLDRADVMELVSRAQAWWDKYLDARREGEHAVPPTSAP
ncbi:hypothetical protein [Micromonospora aurantiaca (nom. illeg.)]|uniref:hypothetical protein n=1 Tax=Micromonospora aurantiaca (nom. illeg.) TaxID=47850 RepID=UPI0033CA9D6C